jgi:xanthine dehydrogenase molybdenum-binding subunit
MPSVGPGGLEASEALGLPGVEKVVTCFDVPDIQFPTAGHPWSVEPSHQDVADRKLLNQRVRFYGDDIAAVIARDEVTAERALKLIQVDYDEYPPLLTIEAALAPDAQPIHDACPGNILKQVEYRLGNFEEAIQEPGLTIYEGRYQAPMVQHCHLEKPMSFAYMENGRIVVVTSTQIPHIVRRVIGQALGIPWGNVRVIKPYIGGGFGNKQEVLYEPLNAYLTTLVGGRCVKLDISREETFVSTRVRHAMDFRLKSAVRGDGRLVANQIEVYSNQGAYASHGHAIVSNSVNTFRQLYPPEKAIATRSATVYTNLPSGGAMRGYGVPQIIFALESHMQDIAETMGLDPVAFREMNAMKLGFVDPLNGITCHSTGLLECIAKGRKAIGWDDKRRLYQNQEGPVRRGVGMAIFSYKTGVHPIALETASCRLILNQDGSVQLQMGATEIGQGADTVFAQMAAETTGLRQEDIHVMSTQDTDATPFDPGAYASRQTYVSGMALKDTAGLFRQKLLEEAATRLNASADTLDLRESRIIEKASGNVLMTLADLSVLAFYGLDRSVHITAEATHHCKDNTFSFGVCFAEVEVDMLLGKVSVVKIINVHDSGHIINPQTAAAQIHGGMSMGLGYGLSEQLLHDEKGRPLNGNFLDYKVPTIMDTPDLKAVFVETEDPTGPYGNKSLGEPPAIPVAPAVRNAIRHATGVAFNRIPITPQRMIEKFTEAGLLERGEDRV